MRNCVISLRDTASDYTKAQDNLVKSLNACGIIVSEMFYLTDSAAFNCFAQTMLSFFDNVFLIDTQGVDVYSIFNNPTHSAFVSVQNTTIFFVNGNNIDEYVQEIAHKTIYNNYTNWFGKSTIKAFCLDQNILQKAVKECQDKAGDALKIYAYEKHCDTAIEIIYNQNTPKFIVDQTIRSINASLFDYVYAQENISLAQAAFDALTVRNLVLSVAESFTGGRIASKIIEIAGASKVLFESVVAYSNKSKTQRLNVTFDTLHNYGAVSDQAAYEMAAGLIESGNCQIALSTTGIAGPDADGTLKPKGLCFVAVGTSSEVNVFKYLFNGSREDVTGLGVNAALFALIKKIKHTDLCDLK